MYVHIYIYIYVCIYAYIYIHVYCPIPFLSPYFPFFWMIQIVFWRVKLPKRWAPLLGFGGEATIALLLLCCPRLGVPGFGGEEATSWECSWINEFNQDMMSNGYSIEYISIYLSIVCIYIYI